MPGDRRISGQAARRLISNLPWPPGFGISLFTIILPAMLGSAGALASQADSADYDADRALAVSQAAINTRLDDISFTDTLGESVKLSDYRGKPLLISLVFTSCHRTCPVITRQLELSVSAARDALGEDSFNVITVGFDAPNDTPQNMRNFAMRQNIGLPGWDFLSASQAEIDALTRQLGFTYYASARGFDHITQVSILDRAGVVYQQVYGDIFELPWLVEPLKELVFNRPSSERHLLSDLVARVKIFCTVYNPNTGRYRFDYSLFIQILVGLIVVVSVALYLLRESRHYRNP